MNRTMVVGIVALLALIALGAMTAIRGGPQESPDQAPVAPASPVAEQDQDLQLGPRTRGSASAPITIYEVSDFQCPYCKAFWKETLPALEREYIQPGKARIVFINFPITATHKNAAPAHELAMCAAEQNLFWPVHDLLFAHQERWASLADPAGVFLTLADSARLDRAALTACYSAGKARALIEAELQASFQAGVNSTPSFIVNGALLAGHAPIGDWRPILDSIYASITPR
jgi:protein-disulfide isomerase